MYLYLPLESKAFDYSPHFELRSNLTWGRRYSEVISSKLELDTLLSLLGDRKPYSCSATEIFPCAKFAEREGPGKHD